MPDDTPFDLVGRQLAPHIYSEQEITDLLAAARRLVPALRGATYEALFSFLAATVLQISEAVHLMDTDVGLKSGMLTIRQTKFDKSRQLPQHPSTVEALWRYCGLRNLHITVNDEMPFFVSTRDQCLGYPLGMRQVHRVFQSLRNQLETDRNYMTQAQEVSLSIQLVNE